MKINFLTNKKNELEFVLVGERHTFPNLLKSRLLKNSDVSFAAYKLEHPMDNESKFVLKTEKKDAKTVLLNACKEIEAEAKEFQQKVKKAIK